VEDLKQSGQKVAKPSAYTNSGVVQSTPVQSAGLVPINSGGMDDEVVTGLTWAKRMDLDDKLNEEPTDTTSEGRSGGDKVHLTQTQESTMDSLCKAFTPMNNAKKRQLW